MARKNYIKNNNPFFRPSKIRKKISYFIKYAMKQASKIDVARSKLNNHAIRSKKKYENQVICRFRRLNEHRACAMRAMVQAMLYHFNDISNLVEASVEQLSDECGLSTTSQAGNKSITRASRLITHFMEPMGFVKSEKKWDPVLRNYMPKMISLTPLFFMLFDISSERLYNARIQQLGWINKNLLEKGFKKISFVEAKQRSIDARIRSILKYRESKHLFFKKKRKAEKMFSLEEKEAKQKILTFLVKRYSLSELGKMGLQGLKKQVNTEYYYLKKLITTPYKEFYSKQKN